MPPVGRPGSGQVRIVPCGDRAALIQFPGGIAPRVNGWVRSTARLLRQLAHPALGDMVISYATLLVDYDPLALDWQALIARLEEVVEQAERLPPPPGKRVEVPVHYGGGSGPDLAEVARLTGLSEAEVIRRHTATDYLVYALGFSPGFCYLGGLDPALAVPRLDTPRTRVPAGSVGIGGSQTGMYPSESPGGWRLLGRTPLPLFDANQNPPCPVSAGDLIRFRAVPEWQPVAPAPAPAPPAPAPGQAGLLVRQSGLATTVQDLGRRGWQDWGVPVSGAADTWSLRVGNLLLGNPEGAAALELTLLGGEFEFTGPVAFCLAGAPFPAELIAAAGTARPVPPWTVVAAATGHRLRVGAAPVGCRGYLCVRGGLAVPPVLGSRSADTLGGLGPLGGKPPQPGDWLPIGPAGPAADWPTGAALPTAWRPTYAAPAVLRVVLGPQAERFSPEGIRAFLSGIYTVQHQSDRVGVRLFGPAIAAPGGNDILTEGMPLGGIQVPGDGQPIVMLAGRQITGGYAKVAVAIAPDMAVAGQLRPGQPVRFRAVDLAECRRIALAEAERWAMLRQVLAASPALSAAPPGPAESTSRDRTGSGLTHHLRVRVREVEFEVTVEEDP